MWRSTSAAFAVRILEVLEEVRARVEHHDIALVAEALTISLQTAIERVEIRILLERLRVRCGRARIALAFDALSIAVRFSDDDFALAIGIGANLFRFRK